MIRRQARRTGAVLAALGLLTTLAAHPAEAAHGSKRAAAQAVSAEQVEDIRRAIDEQRLLDAGQMIDQATVSGSKDPRLNLLSGELGLARGRFDQALKDFKSAESTPATLPEALQGEGIAMAQMGRLDESITTLRKAVDLAPNAWRAWSALGAQYDDQKDWEKADDAYSHALTASPGSALVHNNRGYSRLLQGRLDEAVQDFVAALQKKPDFAAARTNLRLALAFKGDYARSVAGGGPDDVASLLNNAGFAAGMRGDYAKAQDLLQQAMKSKGQFYDRASENLKLVKGLEAQSKANENAAR
jgi:Flp pilus assembly protein TadD